MKRANKKLLKKLFVVGSVISVPLITNYLIFKNAKYYSTKKIENYYDWKFGKIKYSITGEGSPILLLHDTSVGSGSHEWSKIIQYFARTNKVYTIDFIGFGDSDKPKINYTAYLMVSLIRSFIKNIIKEKVDIIASGNSCSYALVAHYFDENLINKITLVSPQHFIYQDCYPNEDDMYKKMFLESPILGTSIYNFISSKFYIKKYFKDSVYDFSNIDNEIIKTYYLSAHNSGANSKNSYAYKSTKFLNVNTAKHLQDIEIPIKIILGEKDNYDNISKFNLLDENKSNITFSIVENSKYLPHLENPKEFFKAYN